MLSNQGDLFGKKKSHVNKGPAKITEPRKPKYSH